MKTRVRALVFLVFLAFLLADASSGAGAGNSPTGLDAAHAVIESLPATELERWLAGTEASKILLNDGRTLEQALSGLGSLSSIAWFTIDSGGGDSASVRYRLRGTAGQPEPGPAASGTYTVTGGFWTLARQALVFGDGFESGDTSAWSTTLP